MLRTIGAILWLTGGSAAVVHPGPDLTSIAALITSLSGVAATVGGFWLAKQRTGRSRDAAAIEQARQFSELQAERDLLMNILRDKTSRGGSSDGETTHA